MVFKKRISPQKQLFLKTGIITTVAASVIAFSSGPAAFANSSKFTTNYYVYLNHKYIGTVSDRSIVDKLIAEKTDALKKSNKDMNLNLGSQIEYISEQVFRSTANDQEVVDKLENAVALEAESAAIVIDGKPVVFLQSKNAAGEVIKKLKLDYVTEDQLNQLEARKTSPSKTLPPLKENETRLLDVRLSKEVSVDEEKATPDKIMTVEEALTFLQKGTLEEKKYAVQEGDVLGAIANDHGLKLADLLALNPGLNENSLLKVGQQLNITMLKPFLEVVVEKETNLKENIPYQVESTDDSSITKGETKVKQEGKNGLKVVNYQIIEQNGVAIKKVSTSEQVLNQPVNEIVIKGTKVIPSRGEGRFAWPTVGGYISSTVGYRWGKMHKGIDIARPSNRTIKAADNGVVKFASWGGAMGNKVIIDHGNGFTTVYAHLASIGVQVGQTVSTGDTLGIMGATGDATGVHLHFEVYKNGALQNPLDYLNR
jgi:murein DD-endopeptidase MepM/ murein hydrolase activator NlpD